MRKLSSDEKFDFQKKADAIFRHEKKREIKRKKLRLAKEKQKIKERLVKKFDKTPKKIPHENCKAPELFSVTQEPVSVIKYFEQAGRAFQNKLPVIFDLSLVKEMDTATLTLLCARVSDKKFVNGNLLKGNVPQVPELKEMFVQSGFYNFVISRVSSSGHLKDEYGELIHRVTRKKVESELAGKVCLSAISHTYESDSLKIQNLYKIVIECMANTWNHASGGQADEEYNWWLLAYKEKNTNITKFCFLDLGVGIFGSLDQKYKKKSMPRRLLQFFVPDDNIKTLQQIFSGDVKTSTNKPERGRGINNIYNLVKGEAGIRNFSLITNNVHSKIGYNTPDQIITISQDFPGTLYYWELVPNL